MNRTDLIFLTTKYKKDGLTYKEIKCRLEQLKFELKINKPKKEKRDIENIFKDHFKILK